MTLDRVEAVFNGKMQPAASVSCLSQCQTLFGKRLKRWGSTGSWVQIPLTCFVGLADTARESACLTRDLVLGRTGLVWKYWSSRTDYSLLPPENYHRPISVTDTQGRTRNIKAAHRVPAVAARRITRDGRLCKAARALALRPRLAMVG
ncbi:hypothetical protein EVAR_29808_1 [Eumeta japonica]|uniref:Uncharacterized protein n=1 Tax=Eumeta variegata TaxID=151549 RepID=A0A4C1XRF6_EUMVA|nr:hypothetical protein EVAR_29808_1 [Eumeta japonica]